MSREPDGFLGRWSARKQAARGEVAEQVQEAPVAADAPPEPEKSDAEILEELGLKDPDDMAPGDDFSAFMASGIPERLRNRALRKLWLTNPVLANLDELLEYGEDYTDAAMVVENLQTAYRVGKGFLKRAELEDNDDDPAASPDPADAGSDRPAAADGAAVEGEEAEQTDISPDAVSDQPDRLEIETAGAPVEAVPAHAETPEREGVPIRPRRMVFRVENS